MVGSGPGPVTQPLGGRGGWVGMDKTDKDKMMMRVMRMMRTIRMRMRTVRIRIRTMV